MKQEMVLNLYVRIPDQLLVTLLEDGKTVLAQPLEGVQADICLGIARYHFEVGSGHTDIVVR